MSRPSCIACGLDVAACSCQPHHLHAGGADHKNRTFSIFPDLHDHQLGMHQPQGGLHEFQFFGQSDHESVAWLFDDDPPPTIGDDEGSPDEKNHHHQRPSTFHPFAPRYHPGNGLTFEVSLDQSEVHAGLGLVGGGGQITEPAASPTVCFFL